MSYVLYISNKAGVNSFYEVAWNNALDSYGLQNNSIKLQLLEGTVKSIPESFINASCKGIILNWMGQNEDKRVLHIHALAKEKKIPFLAHFTYGCNPVTNLLEETVAKKLVAYLDNGGMNNIRNMYLFLQHYFLAIPSEYQEPVKLAWAGIYRPEQEKCLDRDAYLENYYSPDRPTVAINFPRDHWAWGHTEYINRLIKRLEELGCNALPIFSHWNRDREKDIPGFELNFRKLACLEGQVIPQVLINCQWFSLTVGRDVEDKELLKSLDMPIIQGVILLQQIEEWKESAFGLGENELQANVIMPEFDGVVHGVPVAGQQKLGSITKLVPIDSNIDLVARRAKSWAQLKRKANKEKKIALIFHNYPAGNATIGTAMALDSLQSGERILTALKQAGYQTGELPKESGWLAKQLLAGFTNELEYCKPDMEPCGTYSVEAYRNWYQGLLIKNQKHIQENWGALPGASFITEEGEEFKIAGFHQGNVFISVQPPRISFGDLQKSLHNGNIPPTHYYLAYYRWLVETYKADAVIHLGTHGSLEWLPGKSTGLGKDSYPYLAIDSLPNLYPYLISITCEGLQAKRRGSAVLIDHLPAPCEESGLYGELLELSNLVEQYLEAEKLNSSVLPKLEQVLADKLQHEDILNTIGLEPEDNFSEFIHTIHTSLEKIASSQCRTGLHILGEIPTQKELDSLVKAFTQGQKELEELVLEKLSHTKEEISHLIEGLSGHYIESGLSGAPTTGMLDCLPSGKNFYGVDPRLIPSKAAWLMGQELAEQVINLYIEEERKYPERIAMILWSGTNMRTKGCDVAQAMALLGVEPEWNNNGRVSGLRVIPLEELKRPRIDVVLRISGMYRDSLYPTVEYLDECIKAVMALEEDSEVNYPRKHLLEDGLELEEKDINKLQCRIFGSAPGTYGAGVNLAIESRNWQSIDDLKDVFISWGSYAYGKEQKGEYMPEIFSKQLSKVDVTVKNEDHYETTMLESDDYNAFHGGMIAAVRSLSGKAPKSYCGNLSKRDKVSVQTLSEEMKQLYLAQVLNPKFIQGMKKHGYKGAADLCNIVTHSFAWDATSKVIEDWMYNKLTEKYIQDEEINKWLREINPWALKQMCATLLEAKQRGLWKAPKELEETLLHEYLGIEGELEELSDQ